MRLTLRTLIAYMDDVLEPQQTKEIGQKIQESPVAAELLGRIREVIRRRRLGAPDVDGPGQGIDPNIVAQYLDNTLPPEGVAEVEAVCLDADLHLAEVAACHQVLTVILGDPVDVPPRSLDRFYALGPVTADSQLQVPSTNEGPARPGSKASLATLDLPVAKSASGVESNGPVVPDYLKSTPWSQQYGPMLGIAVVAVAALFVLLLDRDVLTGLGGGSVANRPAGKAPAAAAGNGPAVAATTPVTAPSTETNQPPAIGAAATAAATPAVTNGERPAAMTGGLTNLPARVDGPPPPDVPEPTVAGGTKPPAVASNALPTTPPATAPAATSPSATSAVMAPAAAGTTAQSPVSGLAPAPVPMPLGIPTPGSPAPGNLPPATPPAVAVDVVTIPIQYLSPDGVLLRFEATDQHWYLSPRRAELHALEVFAIPEPYEAQFDFDRGQLRATALSETVMQVLPSSSAIRSNINIRRGRMLLQPGPAVAEGSTKFGLSIGEHRWIIDLSGKDALVGVEVQAREPQGLDKRPAPDAFHALLFVVSGTVQVQAAGAAAPSTLLNGQMLRLSNEGPPGETATLGEWPIWLDASRRQASSTLRRYAALFEKEFDAQTPVDLTIPALFRDPRPKIAELGTRCLAILDDSNSLAQSLAQSDHEEARAAAANGLRAWVVSAEGRGALLKRELETHYSPEEAGMVYRLLWGYSALDAQDRLLSLQLVEWLRSSRVEIRELAFQQLVHLTGRRYDFRATGPASQREAAVQRWFGHIEREKALVKPVE